MASNCGIHFAAELSAIHIAAGDCDLSGEVGVDFSAVVTDIRLESREGAAVRWRMTLDRTEFAAGDVGVLHAVSRGGTRIEVPVLVVVADEAGDLWHVVEKPLAAGTDVVGRVTR
jgi:alanyl-tRNA synthetase